MKLLVWILALIAPFSSFAGGLADEWQRNYNTPSYYQTIAIDMSVANINRGLKSQNLRITEFDSEQDSLNLCINIKPEDQQIGAGYFYVRLSNGKVCYTGISMDHVRGLFVATMECTKNRRPVEGYKIRGKIPTGEPKASKVGKKLRTTSYAGKVSAFCADIMID